MIENKYFVPDIEDIRIGYECEVQKVTKAWTHIVNDVIKTDLVHDVNWESVIIKNKYELVSYLELISTAHIRTPYLTKEQIEAEDWKPNGIKVVNDGIYFRKSDNIGLNFDVLTHSIQIYQVNSMIDWNLYFGECKDINTFRSLCKLLKI